MADFLWASTKVLQGSEQSDLERLNSELWKIKADLNNAAESAEIDKGQVSAWAINVVDRDLKIIASLLGQEEKEFEDKEDATEKELEYQHIKASHKHDDDDEDAELLLVQKILAEHPEFAGVISHLLATHGEFSELLVKLHEAEHNPDHTEQHPHSPNMH